MHGCLRHTTPPPSVEARITYANTLAATAKWQARTIYTPDFVFKAYAPKYRLDGKMLTIYIEGDGLAWKAVDTPSDNPTPISPIGLKLAIRDKKHMPVVYLARACQFVAQQDWRACHMDYWTARRFAPAIIKATNQAINSLKIQAGAKKITLIGYSGGGTIAALVAAHRTDILELITIAAPLDINYWVRQKSLTPLYGSLNPADAVKTLAAIPQVHWVGGRDTVVPKEVAFAYVKRFPSAKKPTIKIIPSFNHHCCWAKNWAP